MNTPAEFTWIPFYEEWADKLVAYKDRQRELIEFLESLRSQGQVIPSLQDQDASGARFLIRELDPFTFIGVVNRGITAANRLRLLEAMKVFFGVQAAVPRDFSGIPTLNNRSSWFLPWSHKRSKTAVSALWEVFELALGQKPLESDTFARAVDAALELRLININLTMGLFWIRPHTFLSLDSVMRERLGIRLPQSGLSFASYRSILEQVTASHGKDFPTLSYEAWLNAVEPDSPSNEPTPAARLQVSEPTPINEAIDYWMVGAYWDDHDPRDQTQHFVSEGIWENGYTDRYLDVVRAMKPGDRIAIKSSATQKIGLPFDNGGLTASKMAIKATGTVLKNHGDGRVVEVEWDKGVQERAWYFYTARPTVWRLNKANELARRLIRFAFHGEPQDYDYFLKIWDQEGEPAETESTASESVAQVQALPFGVEDVLAAGAFLSLEEVERILERLERKKNLILQGAPGVGKTFLARLLAYALIQARDDARITYVQFHPSYTYEDFVRGYRPTNEAGKFELVEGPLLQACAAAALDPDRPYVLLIDEVNRGNTSQIFGELLSLIEADKRGATHAVVPLYRRSPNERFSVPENLYVIGTMNIADRSLALVDYALRRRFAFVTLEPRYADLSYKRWAEDRQMPSTLLSRIVARMNALNGLIASDSQLGPAFRVGHSFFCPRGSDFSGLDGHWFDDIVDTEIIPLLEEYWYDAPEKVRAAAEALRAR